MGTVLVRVPGSETLLTKFDEDFRDKSYNAMIFAAVIALIIAMVMGAILRVRSPLLSKRLLMPRKR